MPSVSIQKLLQEMPRHGASDLHLKQNAPPVYRIHGRLTPIKREPVEREELLAFLAEAIPQRLRAAWDRDGALDFAFSADSATRFRGNAYYQRGAISVALRRLQTEDLSFANLGLPPAMDRLAEARRGMILITGPTGAGKTTTMPALIETINRTRREHIVTIEDPIEYVYRDRKSVIEQREIGIDAISFDVALKHALRQDPDVILLGEMRDLESIAIALRAALTGHLVISTLHTINATMTVNRIVQYFPADHQASVRSDLAAALRGIVSQRLIPAGDGARRVPIVEVLLNNEVISKLIRDDRAEDCRQVLQNGMDGMQTFDQALVDLVRRQVIGEKEGENYCENLQAFRRNIRGEYAGGDQSGILGR